jgi:hypothetical protein
LCLSTQAQIGTRKVYCPERSFLHSPANCNNVKLTAAALSSDDYFVLEKAPKVPGQPQLHGQFYIRAVVRAATTLTGCSHSLLDALALWWLSV